MNDVHADLNTQVHDPGQAKLARTVALVFALVFLVVGIAGFIPGITTNYGELQFAGHESGAQLLGLFQVSVVHNLVHLLFGAVGILAATKAFTAVWYLILGGTFYFFLWLVGVGVEEHSEANVVALDNADNWLHLGLSIAMVALGFWGLNAFNNQSHLHEPGEQGPPR